jgi:membrane associated rhomboid family serine protease
MLIIPLTDKISWRNPPIITIILVLMNCFVYFVFQFQDNPRYFKSEEFYFTSGLAEIEITKYVEYKDPSGSHESLYNAKGELNEKEAIAQYQKMNRDNEFLTKLRNDEIITPDDPQYSRWRALRDDYEYQRSKITTLNYGFIPAEHKPITFITHMFMHGGFGHLLGNMIFLWLGGVMLEMGGGRKFYSVSYILAGLGAVIAFWLIDPQSPVPLVGASGAIAGLMGAFTVLYCRRKVKIFFSLGFIFFSYFEIRSIFLLPIWVAMEFYQLFFGGMSNVAYVAHIGGYVSGALIGFFNLTVLKSFNAEVLEPEPEDEISPIIEKALRHIRQLDMESGSKLLEQALAKDPRHIGVMTHLFNARKTDPQDPRFHEITRKLLSRLTLNTAHYKTAGKIFNEYTKLTKRPQLTADLYFKMSSILAGLGYPEKAERILAMFIKQKPDFPGIPSALLKLATGYRHKGVNLKYQRYLQLIDKRYPNSSESEIARRQLAQSSGA